VLVEREMKSTTAFKIADEQEGDVRLKPAGLDEKTMMSWFCESADRPGGHSGSLSDPILVSGFELHCSPGRI
jgi:hypothetical protein